MSEPGSPLVVHHLNDSRSQRILWLLVRSFSRSALILTKFTDIRLTQEELQIPYEIKKYTRTSEQRAPKELLDIHPLGKSPVITDGEVTLAESGAIVGMSWSYMSQRVMYPLNPRVHHPKVWEGRRAIAAFCRICLFG